MITGSSALGEALPPHFQFLTERYNPHLLPASTEEWTADDEGKLQRLKSSEINLADTALGRQQALLEQQFNAAALDMPDEMFDRYMELRKRKREENNAD